MTLSAAAFERDKSSGAKLGTIGASPSAETPSIDAGEFIGKHKCERSIVIIDNRALDRECLAQSLRSHCFGAAVSTFATVEELRRTKEHHRRMSAILLNIGGLTITDDCVVGAIEQLKS